MVFNFFRSMIGLFTQTPAIPEISTVDMDSEFRFYGVMFAFYGAVLIHTGRHFPKNFERIPVLISVFFLAGLARVISYLTMGKPHLLFIVLGVIEIVLPVIMLMLWFAYRRGREN